MKSNWLICSSDSSTKQVLYKMLFLESLIVTLAIVGAVVSGKSPELHFREEGFITYISCLQLAIASVMSGQIFIAIWKANNRQLARNSKFWLFSSLGLLFLAFDDAFEIHEKIDFWLHDLLNIQETMLTDLADDLIVGGYLLLFLLYVLRQWQTIKLFQPSFVFFKAGILLAAAMVILDISGNNTLFVSLVFEDYDLAIALKQWLGAIEDSAKIFAEGMILVGLYRCRQIVKGQNSNQ